MLAITNRDIITETRIVCFLPMTITYERDTSFCLILQSTDTKVDGEEI